MSEPLLPLPDDWDRALGVVAHPDDLEYGAASAIAAWTRAGKWVGYVLATSGEAGIDGMSPLDVAPLRREEERSGAAHVGVSTVEFLDHPDGVVEYGLALRRDLARAIRRHRPEVIITVNHHETFGGPGFNMADHRVVGLAALDAARDAGNRWIFPELVEEGLEPWSGVRHAFVSASPFARHGVDVTETLDLGVASLLEHRAYLDGLGDHPMRDADTFLRNAARELGPRLGTELAVAFECLDL